MACCIFNCTDDPQGLSLQEKIRAIKKYVLRSYPQGSTVSEIMGLEPSKPLGKVVGQYEISGGKSTKSKAC